MQYGQFCPIAKAMELLGEKWTLLIARELLMGGRRFSDLQKGLSQISPTLLTKRLAQLEEHELVFKKRISGRKGFEYYPTQSCKDLLPVMEQVGTWGMRWTRHQLTDSDFDLELLMLYLQRSVKPDRLIADKTTIRFHFLDLTELTTWWILVDGDEVDVCHHDPGEEVDVYFNVCVPVMCRIWMGELSYKKAIAQKQLQLIGPKVLIKDVEHWLKPSIFAGIAPANEIIVSDSFN